MSRKWFNVTPAFPFASSRETNSRQPPVPAAAISSQPVAEGRSRAGKPERHSFVSIRGSFGQRWSLTPGHRTDQRTVLAAPTAGRTSTFLETEWSRPPRQATAGDGDLNGRSRTLATPPLRCAALPRTTIEQHLSSARKESLRLARGNCVNTPPPPLW